MYHVYLLESEKDHRFYIGRTDNLEKRLARHNNGLVSSTKNKRPWKLLGYETYESRRESRWREFVLKKNTSEKKRFIKNFRPRSSTDRM